MCIKVQCTMLVQRVWLIYGQLTDICNLIKFIALINWKQSRMQVSFILHIFSDIQTQLIILMLCNSKGVLSAFKPASSRTLFFWHSYTWNIIHCTVLSTYIVWRWYLIKMGKVYNIKHRLPVIRASVRKGVFVSWHCPENGSVSVGRSEFEPHVRQVCFCLRSFCFL